MHIGSVQVRPLDFVPPDVCPVHLAAGHIQCQAVGAIESGTTDQVFDVCAIEIAALYIVRAPVRPVELRHSRGGWSRRCDRDAHGIRAVVVDVAFTADIIYTRAVVVSPHTRWCSQIDRFSTCTRRIETAYGICANYCIAGRDCRVGRTVIAQGRRSRRTRAPVAHRRAQREGRTRFRAGIADRGRFHNQVGTTTTTATTATARA